MDIEKGIPCPATKKVIASAPFGEMEIGDSIFFADKKLASSYSSLKYQFNKYHDRKFSGSTVEGGIRVWRIK